MSSSRRLSSSSNAAAALPGGGRKKSQTGTQSRPGSNFNKKEQQPGPTQPLTTGTVTNHASTAQVVTITNVQDSIPLTVQTGTSSQSLSVIGGFGGHQNLHQSNQQQLQQYLNSPNHSHMSKFTNSNTLSNDLILNDNDNSYSNSRSRSKGVGGDEAYDLDSNAEVNIFGKAGEIDVDDEAEQSIKEQSNLDFNDKTQSQSKSSQKNDSKDSSQNSSSVKAKVKNYQKEQLKKQSSTESVESNINNLSNSNNDQGGVTQKRSSLFSTLQAKAGRALNLNSNSNQDQNSKEKEKENQTKEKEKVQDSKESSKSSRNGLNEEKDLKQSLKVSNTDKVDSDDNNDAQNKIDHTVEQSNSKGPSDTVDANNSKSESKTLRKQSSSATDKSQEQLHQKAPSIKSNNDHQSDTEQQYQSKQSPLTRISNQSSPSPGPSPGQTQNPPTSSTYLANSIFRRVRTASLQLTSGGHGGQLSSGEKNKTQQQQQSNSKTSGNSSSDRDVTAKQSVQGSEKDKDSKEHTSQDERKLDIDNSKTQTKSQNNFQRSNSISSDVQPLTNSQSLRLKQRANSDTYKQQLSILSNIHAPLATIHSPMAQSSMPESQSNDQNLNIENNKIQKDVTVQQQKRDSRHSRSSPLSVASTERAVPVTLLTDKTEDQKQLNSKGNLNDSDSKNMQSTQAQQNQNESINVTTTSKVNDNDNDRHGHIANDDQIQSRSDHHDHQSEDHHKPVNDQDQDDQGGVLIDGHNPSDHEEISKGGHTAPPTPRHDEIANNPMGGNNNIDDNPMGVRDGEGNDEGNQDFNINEADNHKHKFHDNDDHDGDHPGRNRNPDDHHDHADENDDQDHIEPENFPVKRLTLPDGTLSGPLHPALLSVGNTGSNVRTSRSHQASAEPTNVSQIRTLKEVKSDLISASNIKNYGYNMGYGYNSGYGNQSGYQYNQSHQHGSISISNPKALAQNLANTLVRKGSTASSSLSASARRRGSVVDLGASVAATGLCLREDLKEQVFRTHSGILRPVISRKQDLEIGGGGGGGKNQKGKNSGSGQKPKRLSVRNEITLYPEENKNSGNNHGLNSGSDSDDKDSNDSDYNNRSLLSKIDEFLFNNEKLPWLKEGREKLQKELPLSYNGHFMVLLQRISSMRSQRFEQLQLIRSAMDRHGLPKNLQERVLQFHVYSYMNHDQVSISYWVSYSNLFGSALSSNLKVEIKLWIFRGLIRNVPFFHEASPKAIKALVCSLNIQNFSPGDVVIRCGDTSSEMYFILRGSCQVLRARDLAPIKTLREHDYFGEFALLFSKPRRRTAWIQNFIYPASQPLQVYCTLASLGATSFNQILDEFPDQRMLMRAKIKKVLGEDPDKQEKEKQQQQRSKVTQDPNRNGNMNRHGHHHHSDRHGSSGHHHHRSHHGHGGQTQYNQYGPPGQQQYSTRSTGHRSGPSGGPDQQYRQYHHQQHYKSRTAPGHGHSHGPGPHENQQVYPPPGPGDDQNLQQAEGVPEAQVQPNNDTVIVNILNGQVQQQDQQAVGSGPAPETLLESQDHDETGQKKKLQQDYDPPQGQQTQQDQIQDNMNINDTVNHINVQETTIVEQQKTLFNQKDVNDQLQDPDQPSGGGDQGSKGSKHSSEPVKFEKLVRPPPKMQIILPGEIPDTSVTPISHSVENPIPTQGQTQAQQTQQQQLQQQQVQQVGVLTPKGSSNKNNNNITPPLKSPLSKSPHGLLTPTKDAALAQVSVAFTGMLNASLGKIVQSSGSKQKNPQQSQNNNSVSPLSISGQEHNQQNENTSDKNILMMGTQSLSLLSVPGNLGVGNSPQVPLSPTSHSSRATPQINLLGTQQQTTQQQQYQQQQQSQTQQTTVLKKMLNILTAPASGLTPRPSKEQSGQKSPLPQQLETRPSSKEAPQAQGPTGCTVVPNPSKQSSRQNSKSQQTGHHHVTTNHLNFSNLLSVTSNTNTQQYQGPSPKPYQGSKTKLLELLPVFSSSSSPQPSPQPSPAAGDHNQQTSDNHQNNQQKRGSILNLRGLNNLQNTLSLSIRKDRDRELLDADDAMYATLKSVLDEEVTQNRVQRGGNRHQGHGQISSHDQNMNINHNTNNFDSQLDKNSDNDNRTSSHSQTQGTGRGGGMSNFFQGPPSSIDSGGPGPPYYQQGPLNINVNHKVNNNNVVNTVTVPKKAARSSMLALKNLNLIGKNLNKSNDEDNDDDDDDLMNKFASDIVNSGEIDPRSLKGAQQSYNNVGPAGPGSSVAGESETNVTGGVYGGVNQNNGNLKNDFSFGMSQGSNFNNNGPYYYQGQDNDQYQSNQQQWSNQQYHGQQYHNHHPKQNHHHHPKQPNHNHDDVIDDDIQSRSRFQKRQNDAIKRANSTNLVDFVLNEGHPSLHNNDHHHDLNSDDISPLGGINHNDNSLAMTDPRYGQVSQSYGGRTPGGEISPSIQQQQSPGLPLVPGQIQQGDRQSSYSEFGQQYQQTGALPGSVSGGPAPKNQQQSQTQQLQFQRSPGPLMDTVMQAQGDFAFEQPDWVRSSAAMTRFENGYQYGGGGGGYQNVLDSRRSSVFSNNDSFGDTSDHSIDRRYNNRQNQMSMNNDYQYQQQQQQYNNMMVRRGSGSNGPQLQQYHGQYGPAPPHGPSYNYHGHKSGPGNYGKGDYGPSAPGPPGVTKSTDDPAATQAILAAITNLTSQLSSLQQASDARFDKLEAQSKGKD